MEDRLDLTKISQPDAVIVQHGLDALGFYSGTKRGRPGPITIGAYDAYRESLGAVSDPESRNLLVDRFVEILVAEEGVREVPKDSNRGTRVQEYQSATWLDGTGWPWCAAFVCWGLLELGEENYPFPRPRTAGAWDFERWAREDAGDSVKLFKPRRRIEKGDLLCYTFSHIGVAVEDEKGGRVRTVEGNTSASGSREGGGVYIQRRATTLVRSHIRLFP